MSCRSWIGTGQADGDGTGPGAKIRPTLDRFLPAEADGEIQQLFRLLPRDKSSSAHLQKQIPPRAETHQVLQGFLFAEVALPNRLQLRKRDPQSNRPLTVHKQFLQIRPGQTSCEIEQPVEIH